VFAEQKIRPAAQEPLTDSAIGLSGNHSVKVVLPWVDVSRRLSCAVLDPSAALCAAFNFLTLKRAWLDGSSWFIRMARSDA
jgi:hypothetical protein